MIAIDILRLYIWTSHIAMTAHEALENVTRAYIADIDSLMYAEGLPHDPIMLNTDRSLEPDLKDHVQDMPLDQLLRISTLPR